MFLAGVAHPVERHLAKVEVASSSLVTRSIKKKTTHLCGLLFYGKSGVARKIQCNCPVDSCLIPSSRNQHITRCPKDTGVSSLVTRSMKS